MINILLIGAELMDLLVGVEHDTTVMTSLAAKIVTSAQAVMVAPMKNPRRRWVEFIWFHHGGFCVLESIEISWWMPLRVLLDAGCESLRIF